MVAGDVVVVLQQSDHPLFRRDGVNLFYKKTLTLLEALTGFSFTIAHLDGRTLMVKSDASMIVKPGDVKKIADEGLPKKGNPYERGNLYVEFDVTFPSSAALTESSKKILKSILPPPATPADTTSDAMSDAQPEEVTLQTVDLEAEKRKFQAQEREDSSNGNAHDEDDEDGGHAHGRGQPQCRQQ
jgi:DnaJ-class molecular chaperone